MYQQPSGGRGNQPSKANTRNDGRVSRTSLVGRESTTKVNPDSTKPIWRAGLPQCKITDDWEKQIYKPYNSSAPVRSTENAPDRTSQNPLSRSMYQPNVKRSGHSFQERIIYPTKRGKNPRQSQNDVLSQVRRPSNSRLSIDKRQSRKSLTQEQYLEQTNSLAIEQVNEANKQNFDSTPQLIGRKRSSSGRLRGNGNWRPESEEYQDGGYPINGSGGGNFYTKRGRRRSQKSGLSIRDQCDDTQGFFDEFECEPPKVFKTQPYIPMLFPNPSYAPSRLPPSASQSPPSPMGRRNPAPPPPQRDPVTPNDRSRKPRQSFVQRPPLIDKSPPDLDCSPDDLDDFIPPRPPLQVEPPQEEDCDIFEEYDKYDKYSSNKYESFRPERASLAATSINPRRGSTRFASTVQAQTLPQQVMSEATQLPGQACLTNLESQIASIAQACIPGMISSILQLQAPNSTFLRPEIGALSRGYLQLQQQQEQPPQNILGGVRLSDGFGLSPGLGTGLGLGLGLGVSQNGGMASTPGFSLGPPPLNYSTTTTTTTGQQQPSCFFRETISKNCQQQQQQQQIPLYRTVEIIGNEQQQQIPLLKTGDIDRKGRQSGVFIARGGGVNNGQPQMLQFKMVETDQNSQPQVPLYQTSDGLASIYPSGPVYAPSLMYPPPVYNRTGRQEQQPQQLLQNYLDTQTTGGAGPFEQNFKSPNFSDLQETEIENPRGNTNTNNICRKPVRKPVCKPSTKKFPGFKSKFQICDTNELYKQLQQLNNEQKSTAHTCNNCNCCCKPRKCCRNVSAQKIEKLRKYLCKMKDNECDGLEIRGTRLNCCFPSITKLDSRRELKIPGTKLFNEREVCFMKKLCSESKARCACTAFMKPEPKEDCCEALLNCLCPAKRESEPVTKNCKKGKIATTNHNKYGYPTTKNALRDQGNEEDENEDEGEEEDVEQGDLRAQTQNPSALDPTHIATQTIMDTSTQPNQENQNSNVTKIVETVSDNNATQTDIPAWETSELKPFTPPGHAIKPTMGIAYPVKTSWKPDV